MMISVFIASHETTYDHNLKVKVSAMVVWFRASIEKDLVHGHRMQIHHTSLAAPYPGYLPCATQL
jgi:hypothetical protein